MIPSEIRATLKPRLAALNVSLTVLSEIAGCTVSQLSRFLGGSTGTDFKDLQRVNQIVSGMERLAHRAAPLPIDFRPALLIRSLIKKESEGLLDITVKDQSRPLPQPFVPDLDTGALGGAWAAVAGQSALAGIGIADNPLARQDADVTDVNVFKSLTAIQDDK